MKGTYLLIILITEKASIRVGAQGIINFRPSYYVYVGSAMAAIGSATLLNRVKRHLKNSKEKNMHWHIDYLLNSNKSKIIELYLIPSKQRLECIIADELSQSADDFILHFGCSDCSCKSHLFYYNSKPKLSNILGNQNM
jgi:Uri superfamily endonuclease